MRELLESRKLSFPATIQNLIPTIEMREPTTDSAVAYAVALLKHYGFELRGYTAEELVNLWLQNHSAHWVRLGVIEALYQGRYKAVSVEQILAVWARRGQPIYRFNHEFERLISRKLPQKLAAYPTTRATDLNLEPSLPLFTPSLPETFDESVRVESIPEEPLTTANPETVAPTTMSEQEVAKTFIQLDDEGKEASTDRGTRSNYDANWSRCEVNKQPIHQFTPPPDPSDFYLKLKSVVLHQDEMSAQIVTPINEDAESEPPPPDCDQN
ncbi:hypothetical protein H6F96_02105 [Microcoleus sp. FACHB-53]|nr:hypothetical protein [Microcoleus sp. FACHB-53]MBD2125612.1 hypothetical protein [Microcoleus sp. FACHB-1]